MEQEFKKMVDDMKKLEEQKVRELMQKQKELQFNLS
jgi:hypothetical protein